MDNNSVLAYLEKQYPGQLVLYAAELAKILGKSEKAVRQLIARGGLPFSVKSVGGRRCVDIFQVAEWFASTLDNSEELAPTSVAYKPVRPKRKNGTEGNRQGSKAKGASVRRSPISSLLSDMRNARALAMMACKVTDATESAFIHDLAKHIAFPGAGRYDAPYLAICERVTAGWVSGAVTREYQKCYLDSVYDATSFIQSFQQHPTPDVLSVRVVIRQGRRTLYDGYSSDGLNWFAETNLIGFEI